MLRATVQVVKEKVSIHFCSPTCCTIDLELQSNTNSVNGVIATKDSYSMAVKAGMSIRTGLGFDGIMENRICLSIAINTEQ